MIMDFSFSDIFKNLSFAPQQNIPAQKDPSAFGNWQTYAGQIQDPSAFAQYKNYSNGIAPNIEQKAPVAPMAIKPAQPLTKPIAEALPQQAIPEQNTQDEMMSSEFGD